jgi:hypothetical protein
MRDKWLRETKFLHDAGDGFLSIAHAKKNPQAVFIGKTFGQERDDLEVLGRRQGFAAGGFKRMQFFLLSRRGSFQQFSLGCFPHGGFSSTDNARGDLRGHSPKQEYHGLAVPAKTCNKRINIRLYVDSPYVKAKEGSMGDGPPFFPEMPGAGWTEDMKREFSFDL